MKIIVNDQEIQMCGSTVTDLLNCLDLPLEGCAVAVGEKIVPFSQWDTYTLSENDHVTLIRATQGG